jgi:hypothetical protein
MTIPRCYFCPRDATCVVDATAAGKVLGRMAICAQCLTDRKVPQSAVVVDVGDMRSVASAAVCWCADAARDNVLLSWCPEHGRLLP